MTRRFFLSVALHLGLMAIYPMLSPAVEIDAGLQAQFAVKSDAEKVPVLMIFAQANRVDSRMGAKWQDAEPRQRRMVVLAALREKARQGQNHAAKILNDPRWQSRLGRVQYLYLANAIAFDANREVVAALADLADDAVLMYDRPEDLTAATHRGVLSAAAGRSTAAVDTVWSTKYIHADRVWRELGYDGSGVLVGHIDTGIWLSHPDLAGRLWVNPGEIPANGIDDDGNGFVDDVNGWDFGANDNDPNDDTTGGGHGTHTAGTVAGDGSGGTLTGTAPGATLMALKVWRPDGNGATLGMLWAAEQYAVENGARIITMSLGFSGTIPEIFMRAERHNDDNIRDAGVVFFNSAGNDHLTQTPPDEVAMIARVPAPWNSLPVPRSSTGGVISVGGTGYKDDTIFVGSSRGPVTWGGVAPWDDWPYDPEPGLIKPDIGAPGVKVNSTVVGGGYSGDTWSGTSMACPHAAGVAALMLQKNPSLSPAGVDSLMELNAVDLGLAGKDNSSGSGRLDAYAIVVAVPTVQNPDLAWTSVLPDPDGDAVIDPGAVNPIAFELRNASPMVDATGVTARLAVIANPWVSVVDDSADFGALAADGGVATNTDNTFSLEVAAEAPQGFGFTMLLTVMANGTYQQTYDIPWYVGLPDWRTHDLGGMFLSITDQGSIGYMTQNQIEGRGMGFQDSGSNLFVGSFWAGTDVSYICNRDYNGLGTENPEWVVSDSEPNGRVRDLSVAGAGQTFGAVFTDGGHANPKPLRVEQTTMAFGQPGDNQFVIMEYTLTNEGPADLPALYTGVFCDFDVGKSDENLGGSDASRNLTYMYAEGGRYLGIALLGESNEAQNLTLINNPFYVYPTSAIDDGNKMRLLRGLISEPVADKPDDWSALTSAVVDLPANGGQAIVAYALVIGASLAEITAAVDAANTNYGNRGPIDPEVPTPVFQLSQNAPNPFNPGTEIKYTVPQEGFVELAVYDLRGRRLRTLVSELQPAGAQIVAWDGRDDNGQRVPSGMYFYRYISGGKVTARKMTLLK